VSTKFYLNSCSTSITLEDLLKMLPTTIEVEIPVEVEIENESLTVNVYSEIDLHDVIRDHEFDLNLMHIQLDALELTFAKVRKAWMESVEKGSTDSNSLPILEHYMREFMADFISATRVEGFDLGRKSTTNKE